MNYWGCDKMEKVYLNELSLEGQFRDIDQFFDDSMPVIKCLKYMNEQGIGVSKQSNFYDQRITKDKKFNDLRGVKNDKARRLKRLLLSMADNPPFWDQEEFFKQDISSKYFLGTIDVTATSIAEASEDEKVILSFLHKDYENKELEIIKNKEECLSVMSVYSYDYLEEYLWKNKETDIYDYLKARYIDRRLDFSKFEKEYGFLDFSQSEIEDCIEAFDRFEEAEGWDEIVRDRTLNFKRYSPASNKDDWFRKSEFKDKKIYKFRCKNPKRCFGYREGEKFYVLRMERDHKISDNG